MLQKPVFYLHSCLCVRLYALLYVSCVLLRVYVMERVSGRGQVVGEGFHYPAPTWYRAQARCRRTLRALQSGGKSEDSSRKSVLPCLLLLFCFDFSSVYPYIRAFGRSGGGLESFLFHFFTFLCSFFYLSRYSRFYLVAFFRSFYCLHVMIFLFRNCFAQHSTKVL